MERIAATISSLPPPNVPGRAALDAICVEENLPVNAVRIVVGLLSCCAVAPFYHLLPSVPFRHLANVVLGMSVGWFVFDYMLVHSIVAIVVTYVLLHIAPRKLAGRLVAAFLFAYLIGCHYFREYYEPNLVWDSAQMVLTMKLTGLALSYSDGGLKDDLKTPLMLRNQLLRIPSLLELCGFIYFFPTFLVGPGFEYHEYVDWVNNRRSAPLSIHFKNVLLAIMCIGLFFVSDNFPIDIIDSPEFYPEAPWVIRCLLQSLSVALYRFRFYMVWSLAELGGVLAGYGYSADSNEWSGLTNNHILSVELPVNMRVAINGWNIKVALWLNTYVYQRVALKKGKPTAFSTLASFLVSALWHGLAPGYYIFFIMGALYIEVAKHIRRRYRSFFHYTEDRKAHPHAIFFEYFTPGKCHPLAILYDLGGMLFTWIAMQYAGIAFEILDLQRCIRIWSSWYFAPPIITIVLLVFFNTSKPARRQKTE
ncbi:lysophospholipid acyltransferase [Thraustotheca clavata]|uniref:Lysophospholipid acyltransferase n=1 Tax=Thraustotheca clavata TaxID=74557 RepID=A0A1V9ZDN5_9STRA|nr:lysophospholipid acyltransferase [Thraustotheca clavata]